MQKNSDLQRLQLDLVAEAWELVHSMPTALRAVNHFIEVAIDNLIRPQQIPNQSSEVDSSTVQAAFSPKVTRLADALDRLINATAPNAADRSFSEQQINELQLIAGELRRILNSPVAIAIPEAASNAAIDIQTVLSVHKSQGSKFPGVPEKEVRGAADAVQRLACLYHLYIVQEQIEKLRQKSVVVLEWRNSLEQPFLPKKQVGVNDIVKAAARPSRPLARRRRIKLNLLLGANSTIYVVEEEIVAALQQLISNAIKYSDALPDPEEAWIDIRTCVEELTVLIAVESWGRPIADDEIRLGKIWEPGYRGRFVKKLIPDGAGLGLSRVKRMVDKNSGRIEVTSVPSRRDQDPSDYEHGHFMTTFTLKFPLIISR